MHLTENWNFYKNEQECKFRIRILVTIEFDMKFLLFDTYSQATVQANYLKFLLLKEIGNNKFEGEILKLKIANLSPQLEDSQ